MEGSSKERRETTPDNASEASPKQIPGETGDNPYVSSRYAGYGSPVSTRRILGWCVLAATAILVSELLALILLLGLGGVSWDFWQQPQFWTSPFMLMHLLMLAVIQGATWFDIWQQRHRSQVLGAVVISCLPLIGTSVYWFQSLGSFDQG